MTMTTLCYIEKDGCYLMMHRTKKDHDENEGKYVGIGGKFEPQEAPEDCAHREIFEETGLSPKKLIYRGFITFVSNQFGTEYMHLFTASEVEDIPLPDCDEGRLVWVPKYDVLSLPLWAGDAIFLELLDTDCPFFSLKLVYQNEDLTEAFLNGQKILLS